MQRRSTGRSLHGAADVLAGAAVEARLLHHASRRVELERVALVHDAVTTLRSSLEVDVQEVHSSILQCRLVGGSK